MRSWRLSDSTLGDSALAAGALLVPVNAAQRIELLARDYCKPMNAGGRASDMHRRAKTIAPGNGNTARRADRSSRFQMSRVAPAQKVPRRIRGVLQTDAYGAYNSVISGDMIHAGCWSHYPN